MFHPKHLDKTQLLKALDSLGYSDRMKEVALLGRENKDAAAYSRLLSSLLEGGSYEAQLALTGAEATRDVPLIQAALQHSAVGVRKRAAGLLAGAASTEVIEKELQRESLSPEGRVHFLRSLSIHNRQEVAERLLPTVYTRWGAKEAAILLSACGEAMVREWLEVIGYAVSNWNDVAKRHPEVMGAYFQTALENEPIREKNRVWWRFSSAMDALSRLKPEVVLTCALQHGPKDYLHPVLRQNLGCLIRFDANAVYRLLTREEARGDLIQQGVPESVLKKRRYFTLEQWTAIAVLLADQPHHLAKMLHRLAPSQRCELFEAAYDEDARAARVFPEQLLDELPHALRDKEANRMLGLREIKDSRERTLRITARRLVEHAREPLEQATAASIADERAAALAQLVKCTALSRRGMQTTVAFLKRIKNDQDPVRCAVFTELANSPAFLYQAEQLSDLELLIDSVVEARDTSYSTRMQVERWAFGLMREHASQPQDELFAFALRTLTKLMKQNGQLVLPSFSSLHLPSGMEALLFDRLAPFLKEEAKRENYNLMLQFAAWFGKRGYSLRKLQSMLQEATEVKSASTAAQAARYWLASPQTRDARVRELLSQDKSFITVREVFDHLHRKRQEDLDPFLAGTVIKGKFLSGKTIYLLPALDGFHRWLPRQQKAFRALLERVAFDAKRSQHERSMAIRAMARMPEFWPERVTELLGDKDVYMAEAALHALSLTESPEKALPLLLEHVEGDRARVAMYSVPRCIRRISPLLVVNQLQTLLSRDKLKITVRKEAIRLLGAYRSPQSMELLLKEFEKPQAHKDVVIAIGHAAKQLLNDERSWMILSAMAASPQRDIAVSLLAQRPAELPMEFRARYLTLLLAVAGHADATVGHTAFQSLGQWTVGQEEIVAAAAGEAILNLEDGVRWRSAMNALLEAVRDGKGSARVVDIVRDLADASIKAEWNASPERDLPHRQRLAVLIGRLASLPLTTRLPLAPLFRELMDVLAPQETLQQLVISLQIAIIDWNHPGAAADDLTRVARCLKQQPYLLSAASRQVMDNLRNSKGYWEPNNLLIVVDTLEASESYEATAIGLTVLQAAGEERGWNAECANRLRAYRNHPHGVIRSLALDLWTATE
ncbi:HEAT repeat domain-containing protein [Gorillibacterium sp. CAU 1737]|uniref:HEAT repeat domain-containing protein n=1 Tax=Gorillibacterium sp. CAU 1737 TaxID=3140362 RepID=UPI0032609E57